MQATCTAPSADCQQKVEWRRLKKRLRKQKLPLRLTLNLLPTRDALINPRFGSATMQLLLECGATAIAGGTRECEGCAQRWAMDRPVVGIGIFEFLSVEAAFLVGLCPTCWDRPDRVQVAVAGLERDFGVGDIQVTPLSRGGRAGTPRSSPGPSAASVPNSRLAASTLCRSAARIRATPTWARSRPRCEPPRYGDAVRPAGSEVNTWNDAPAQ